MDFLLLHGNSATYHSVILCGHSMGGILAADAYNFLYSTHIAHQEPGLLNSISSYLSHAPPSDHPSPSDIRFLLRIKGVFAFDSPFYGLHTSVISSGLRKSKELAIVPTDLKPIIDMMPKNVSIPISSSISVPVSTEWVKDQLNGGNPKTVVSESSGSWYEWSKSALKFVGIVGASSVNPISLTQHVEKLMMPIHDYSTFLMPLVSFSEPRINLLIKEHLGNMVVFKAFYNSVSTLSTIQQEDKEPTRIENWFCRLPPNHHKHHFQVLQTPIKDPIDAHTNMFNGTLLGQEYYNWLVQHIAMHIKSALEPIKQNEATI